MVDPYKAFKKISEYDKPLTNLKKENYYSTLSDGTPDPENANKVIKEFNLETGKELTEFYNLTDKLLLADVFRKYVKNSHETCRLNPCFVTISGYTYACALYI